jgi:hypothetical protein
MLYSLTATAGSNNRTQMFHAENDDDAVTQAIAIIMERAYGQLDSPWAIGRIELRNAGAELIREMPAKVDS